MARSRRSRVPNCNASTDNDFKILKKFLSASGSGTFDPFYGLFERFSRPIRQQSLFDRQLTNGVVVLYK